MPHFETAAITISLTGATSGVLTCATTVGVYIGQIGWAVKSDGSGGIQVIVSNVFDGTTFQCQDYSKRNNAGGVDLSAYNGGKIYFDKQVVRKPDQYTVVSIGGVQLS